MFRPKHRGHWTIGQKVSENASTNVQKTKLRWRCALTNITVFFWFLRYKAFRLFFLIIIGKSPSPKKKIKYFRRKTTDIRTLYDGFVVFRHKILIFFSVLRYLQSAIYFYHEFSFFQNKKSKFTFFYTFDLNYVICRTAV